MSYNAEVYNVMIASPCDVNEERKIVREVIYDWNNINADIRKIVLLPLGWEYNSVPSSDAPPQEILNEQIVTKADILVGIFWTRIGTPTGKAISGTVEEIEYHIGFGKPAMLYFSTKPFDQGRIDKEQFEAVNKFKQEYQKNVLHQTLIL